MRTLIGIVGHSPILDAYPLGPQLMRNLQQQDWGAAQVVVENMTWRPIHVTQQLEELPEPYQRTVLIGASAICTEPGKVRCSKWLGGKFPEKKIQERIYEGVTGIVCLDNTVIIGDYFKVWPEELYVVEADIPPDTFGEVVLAESQGEDSGPALTSRLGFDPFLLRQQIEDAAVQLATQGDLTPFILEEKSIVTIPEPELFTQHQFSFSKHAVN